MFSFSVCLAGTSGNHCGSNWRPGLQHSLKLVIIELTTDN